MYTYPQFIASNYISASLAVCISEVVNGRRTDFTISGRKKDQRKNNDLQPIHRKLRLSNTNPLKSGVNTGAPEIHCFHDLNLNLNLNFLVFNATFSNISAISWRPVLVVEEAGVPGENHRPWASNWLTLSLAAASRVHPFCNLQSWARTHAVLVIGLYELLDPTT
jgi:hypothetical protein